MRNMTLLIPLLVIIIAATATACTLPRFGRLPKGARLERIKQSPNYRDGEFKNLNTTSRISSDRSRMAIFAEFLFSKRKNLRPNSPIPAIKSDLKNIPLDSCCIVWLGHSSYYLQLEGKRILVDPVFYDAAPLSMFNRPFQGSNIYKAEDMPDIDYLIITHDHWDHLDYIAVTKLRDRIQKVICPLGVGEHFERWGYSTDKLIEMDWNEDSALNEHLSIHCLTTRHFSGRGLKSNQTLWASFMLCGTSQNIYLSGDGGYDDHFKAISQRFPKIDLALMENGQYGKDWRYIHMMPEDLGKAIGDLNPKAVIAGHNSKYALAYHPWDEPIKALDSASVGKPYTLLKPKIGAVISLHR